MKEYLRLLVVFCSILIFSLSLQAQKQNSNYLNYISKYSNFAEYYRDKFKIPASITLAQGILESGAGLSGLAKASNNHFGIKCHSDWKGERVYWNDDNPNDCFRKYKSVMESYEDHSKFLTQNSRYAVLFTYDIKDYTAWAKGLQTCGYATDKGYANKLIKLIEDYELYEYDRKTPLTDILLKVLEQEMGKDKKTKSKPVITRKIYKSYNLLYVIAEANDSFEKIAEATGFKEKNLIKYNEVRKNYPLKKGDIVYLEKKKSKADLPNKTHVVRIGESMHNISQLYGIQIKKLYSMNKKSSDYVPTEGHVLKLR